VPLIYPSDVDSVKSDLKSQITGLNATVASLGSQVPAATLTQWTAESANITTFANSSTSIWGLGTQMDQGEAYQKELTGWNGMFKSMGGNVPPPPVDPSTSNPPFWQAPPGGQSALGSAMGSAVTLAIIGGGIYVIHTGLTIFGVLKGKRR